MTPTFFSVLATISIIFLIAFFFLIASYNLFIRKRNQVKTDFSDIDVQLKRRATLIEQLVHMVREYAKHEKDTFENVAKARSALDTSNSVKESTDANNMFSQTL